MESIDRGIGISEERVAVTEHVRANLEIAANWGRFVALGGFFLSGFLFVLAIFSLKKGLSTPYFRGFNFTWSAILSLFSIIFFFPGFYIHRFSKNLRMSLKDDDLSDFEVGMDYLKSFFRLSGLYAIVLIMIILLLFGWLVYQQFILP